MRGGGWVRRGARGAAIAAAVLLLMAGTSIAQDAAVGGTIVDSTGGVIPGATVTAVHLDTGGQAFAVSDAEGAYLLNALRPGQYRLTVELAGFGTLQQDIELLVGQRPVLDFEMSVSALEEQVTVLAETPLLDVQQSKMGGNIDSRQMQALPLNGRNWLDLTMLTPGSRVNEVSNDAVFGSTSDTFQLNVDGQQVTSTIAQSLFGQPRFSRDAIAEMEFITSRFDATQGRSQGVQVNAVTKSGTNAFSGTASAYFRDDSMIAEDFVAERVLPYSNQQMSLTLGGPIRQDRAHFFGYYELENEPKTYVYSTPFPAFNGADLEDPRREHKGGVRTDFQFTSTTRLMVRGNGMKLEQVDPLNAGGASHPTRVSDNNRWSAQGYASLVSVWGSNRVNEVNVGISAIDSQQTPRYLELPQVYLSGFTIGKTWWQPLALHQETISIRNNFTFVERGHEVRLGGEFLYPDTAFFWPSHVTGTIDAQGGPIPDDVEALFPVTADPADWEPGLLAVNGLVRRYQQGLGDFNVNHAQPEVALWIQDDWAVTPDLTLNLGLRYDYYHDALANSVEFEPFRSRAPNDKLNVAPRLGFAYTLPTETTVIRGGWGKYFSGLRDQWTHHTLYMNQVAVPGLENDGRPNFAVDPWNVSGGGSVPTYEEALDRFVLDSPGGSLTADNTQVPYTYQTSIGVQQQMATTMAFQADYVWSAGRHQEDSRQINMTYDPATGWNRPFSDPSTRAFPDWGSISMRFSDGRTNYHGLETGFTKRLSDGWQMSATYTLSGTWDDNPLPLFPGCAYPFSAPGVCDVPIELQPVLGGEYTRSAGDQRHRAVVNGIWEMPLGFQLSGLYFFGSGVRYATPYGGDVTDSGGVAHGRVRPDLTVAPRNDFIGDALHRVDMRLTKRFEFDAASIDGFLEVFNLFNHENFGSYLSQEQFGAPSPLQNQNVAYWPRLLQLGFRVSY